jgi:hypothetical protein
LHRNRYFFKKLPELDPDPDLVVKFPDPAKRSGSDQIRIRNTGIVDPKLFIPDPDLDPTSESIRIRILDCASY